MSAMWAPEAPVWFEVNGGRRIVTTCTPDDLQAHAAGYLMTEGYIRTAADIESFDIIDAAPALGVRVKVPDSGVIRVGKLHRHIRENGCGLMHYATCDRALLCRTRPGTVPGAAVSHSLFRELFAAGDAQYPDGGMHTAALTDGERLLYVTSDVGRHNAVDKVLGRALLAGVDLTPLGLLLTARVSGAIALKAARGEVSWVASRSIPTELAVAIAEAAHLPIVARAASKDSVVIDSTAGVDCPPDVDDSV